jgi:Flp pilus assembly protein TadG
MCRTSRRRRGVAAVELAFVLPFLVLIFVVAVDWSRIFYYTVICTNCARNGALYASDIPTQAQSPYANVTQAALADAANLSPPPTVSSVTGTDSSGSYVEVTVSYSFSTISRFPGVPNNPTITRTVRMAILPSIPTGS